MPLVWTKPEHPGDEVETLKLRWVASFYDQARSLET